MRTCQAESFREHVEELKRLIPSHYEELALNKDIVPLDPRWEQYFALEDRGELLFMVMREAGEMLGYFIGMIQPGLHYRTCLTCQMDIFYIRPDKRNGMAGVKLFRAVEQELKRRGVMRWFVGTKLHKDAGALFRRLGFSPVEQYYSKIIERD